MALHYRGGEWREKCTFDLSAFYKFCGIVEEVCQDLEVLEGI